MSENFRIIKASAGAGKTFNLVKEYLTLCLASEKAAQDNFKHILAITFTKAASKDMRRKIMEELEGIIDKPSPTDMANELTQKLGIGIDELRQNARTLYHQILHDYSNFCVSTIDSFNQRLSRSFANELGLPQSFNTTIDDDDISEILIENIGLEISNDKLLRDTLVNLVEKSMEEDETKADISSIISKNYNSIQAEESFEADNKTNCYEKAKYEETKKFLDDKTKAIEESIGNHARQYHDELNRIIDEYSITKDDFNEQSRGIPSLVEKLDYHKNDSKALDNLLKIHTSDKLSKILADDYRWYHNKQKKFEQPQLDEIASRFATVFAAIKENLPKSLIDSLKLYQTIKKDLFKYVLRSKIEQETQNIIDENEKVSISEFNKRIATVLGDFSVPFLYERIGEHFHHIFIDEFQDTSLLQWQNLIPLVDNCLANGNTCLVVGDGKQAIYHFNNGEVRQLTSLPKIFKKPNDNFDAYERKFEDEHEFTVLKQNYRTSKDIVNFNNNFFKYVIDCDDFNLDNKSIYYCQDNKAQIEQEPKKDFNGLIQIELAKDGLTFDNEEITKDEYILRRITEIIEELHQKGHRYKDIAVIAGSNNNCNETALRLSQNEIPVISSTSLLLKTSKRVLLLVNLLTHMVTSDNPANIASILYLWNSLKGASDNETIFSHVAKISNREKEEPLEPHIGMEKGTLKRLQSQSYSLYDLCAALARLLGFDIITDPYLNYFFDTIQNWQTADNVGISNFLNYWEKKKDRLAIKTSDNLDAVQVVTIHKSKGLEYPIVIFPFSKGTLTGKVRNKWLRQSELVCDFEPVPNINKINIQLGFEQTKDQHQEEKNAEDLETTNKIYVAMTRPKSMLFILTETEKNKKNIFERYLEASKNKDPEMRETTNRYGARVFTHGDIDLIEKEKAKNEVTHIITDSGTIDWTPLARLDDTDSPSWLHDVAPATISPAEWGKIVHLILAGITTPDDVDTPAKTPKSIDDDTITALKQRIGEMMAMPAIAKAFGNEATVKTECEILHKGSDGESEILRPDRFAELPDKIILIDYKTGKEKDEHIQQINKYAEALSRLSSKPIEKHLVYISKESVALKSV